MKKVYIASVQPDVDGPVFGRNLNPADFMKAQDFDHRHVEQITKDLLVAGAASAQVAGFAATLTAGLGVSIAKGDVVDQNGVCYETDQEGDGPSVVAMAAAHVSLPRIDLIVATLSIDTPVLTEFESFRRLRTQAELDASLMAYPATQYETPTELHTRATIVVKTGVPNASPAAPVAGDGEAPLWRVHVAAGQVTLGGGDLTDVRPLMKSLYQVIADLAVTNAAIATINTALAGVELLAHKGAANGYAGLDGGGKVPLAQLPAISISDTFPVASQAAMLALTAERGDVAIRSDINQSFILAAEPAATLGNWKQLLFPAPVTSFNGRTGAVALLLADVTAALGYTPVNKAGDSMTGALAVTNSINGLNVLDLLTHSSGQGIRLIAESTVVLLDMFISGTLTDFKVDATSGAPMLIVQKDLNDEFIAKILGGSGGRNWGLLINVSASGIYGESLLRLQRSGVNVIDFLANGLVALSLSTAPDLSGAGKVHMGGDSFRLDQSRSPASNATGKAGEHCWDANFIYICTATNTWKRIALTGGY
jgi:hypothetical protein